MKDKIGIIASLTCLVHCLFFPILGTIFPIFIDLDAPVEIGLLIVAFLMGSLSFIENVLKHQYYVSLLLFCLGFILIICGVIGSELWNFLGMSILIISHYLNYKFIQKKDGCHPHCKH